MQTQTLKMSPVKVTSTKHRVSEVVRDWVQKVADASYLEERSSDEGLETRITEICAINMPVPPHVDAEGKEGIDMTGMKIFGYVIRSDGHRLHSDTLEASGIIEGIPLKEGDVYEIDVFDRHWTTTPQGVENPQLIFSVSIMRPDGRDHKKLGHDFIWTLLAACVESGRNKAA